MARPKDGIEKSSLEITIPKALRDILDGHLKSEALDRVPVGAYSAFIGQLIADFFRQTQLDLHPYAPDAHPGLYVVRGPKTTIERLVKLLQEPN